MWLQKWRHKGLAELRRWLFGQLLTSSCASHLHTSRAGGNPWAELRMRAESALRAESRTWGWFSEQRALVIPVQGDAIACPAFLQCTLRSERFHFETKHLSCTFSAWARKLSMWAGLSGGPSCLGEGSLCDYCFLLPFQTAFCSL